MTCKNCIYEPMCHNVIAYGMDTDDVTATLITDIEKHCKHFKDKSRVIVPPCKVGDTVYIITTKHPCYACNFCTDFCHKDCLIDDRDKRVAKRARVCSIELGAINKICAEVEKTKIATAYKYTCWFEDFGKTVFLTREEAEKALAEREGEG